MDENFDKNLSGKYSRKPLDHAKQSPMDALKTSSKKAIQKTAEETIPDEHDKELPYKSDISPEKRQKIIDALRLI